MEQPRPPLQRLSRLGLSHAALKAAILAEIDAQQFSAQQSDAIADSVADAIDANNVELFRQLRQLLFSE